jgi:hypothetical protein
MAFPTRRRYRSDAALDDDAARARSSNKIREDQIMSRVSGNVGRGAAPVAFAGAANATDWVGAIRVGLLGGLVGGVTIWVYEAVVWVGAQHLMPLAGIPRNATGLVFGKAVQEQLGPLAYLLGTAIHLVFSLGWGVLFAIIWPFFCRRGVEATLVALFYAMAAWIVMHALIAIASSNHPDYLDPNVIIGGFMSHFFYAVPVALIVKWGLGQSAR